MDTGFLLRRLTAGRSLLRISYSYFQTASLFTKSGRLLVTHNVSGVQVHDARLVAAMRVQDVRRILTFNDKDFARYPDIEAVHPRSVSAKHS